MIILKKYHDAEAVKKLRTLFAEIILNNDACHLFLTGLICENLCPNLKAWMFLGIEKREKH